MPEDAQEPGRGHLHPQSKARNLVEQDGSRGLHTFFQLQVNDDAAHRREAVRAVATVGEYASSQGAGEHARGIDPRAMPLQPPPPSLEALVRGRSVLLTVAASISRFFRLKWSWI